MTGFDRYMVVVGAGRNRKFVKLSDSERCAHFLGVLSIAAQARPRGYLLVADGEEAGAAEIANEARVTTRAASCALEKLKRLGVLQRDEEMGAWYVHDWWLVNPDPRKDRTNAERQARHRARQEASRNGDRNAARNAPRNGRITPPEVEVEENLSTFVESSVAASPRLTAEEQEFEQTVERLCQSMSAEVRAAHGIDSSSRQAKVSKAWRDACRAMLRRDGWTVEQIEYTIRWVCRHHYWRYRIKSMTRLRSEMSEVVKDIRRQRERGGQVIHLRQKDGNASDWLREMGIANGEVAS